MSGDNTHYLLKEEELEIAVPYCPLCNIEVGCVTVEGKWVTRTCYPCLLSHYVGGNSTFLTGFRLQTTWHERTQNIS